MRLKTVKLTHFRGYRATTVIPIDEAMTGIVGRNDYGKSTVLEALAIFFDWERGRIYLLKLFRPPFCRADICIEPTTEGIAEIKLYTLEG